LSEFSFTKENVKALRKQAGLTQQQAAESIQRKTSASWRDWESGNYAMTKATVEYFCLKNNLSFKQVLASTQSPPA
jgi:DNA-binding transcriptional regulator YiaG